MDLNREIPVLDLPAKGRGARDWYEQRNILQDWVEDQDGCVSATSVCVEDLGIQTQLLWMARGIQKGDDGRTMPTERPLAVSIQVELATISGRPLASRKASDNAHLKGVKVGLRGFDSPRLRALQMRGGSAVISREYPARFRCDLIDAVRILRGYGFRTGQNPQSWLVYEVGGPLEREVAEWLIAKAEEGEGDIKEAVSRAREIFPDIEVLDAPKSRGRKAS